MLQLNDLHLVSHFEQAEIFVIYNDPPTIKVRPVSDNLIWTLTVKQAINSMIDQRTIDAFKKKRGSEESCKRFAIAFSPSFKYRECKGCIIGQSKKFLIEDDISFLKLTEEPDLVICESEERRKCYADLNIPSITFFDHFMLDDGFTVQYPFVLESIQRVFVEGSLHHALKTQFAHVFGLRYASLKQLKKEGLIV